MHIDAAAEGMYFAAAFVIGIALGAGYDILRTLRVILTTGRRIEAVSDFLYGGFYGLCYFVLITELSLKTRGFILAAMLMGSLLEHILVGRPVVRLVRRISLAVKRKISTPIIMFITKRIQTIKAQFVKNSTKFRKRKKIGENGLKVEKTLVYNVRE